MLSFLQNTVTAVKGSDQINTVLHPHFTGIANPSLKYMLSKYLKVVSWKSPELWAPCKGEWVAWLRPAGPSCLPLGSPEALISMTFLQNQACCPPQAQVRGQALSAASAVGHEGPDL